MKSATGKMPILNSNRSIFRFVLGGALVAALIFILPIYLQNRMSRLVETSHHLAEEVTFLRRDALLLELKINQLSSLENLSAFADSVGLGLNAVPVKIRVLGGN